MSVQQRDDMWKWITRGLMALTCFLMSQMYYSFKELQSHANAITTKIEVVKNEVQYIRKEVDKINNDFYKPSK